jgi:hypothetical protein
MVVLSFAVMMLGSLSSRTSSAQTLINYPSGFANSGSALWLENASTLSGSSIQLTNSTQSAANNIWYRTPVNVQAFSTTFTWTAKCPASPALCADGMGFMIISDPNATPAGFTYSGYSGAQFSWSQCQGKGVNCPEINSILVKFDLYNGQTGAEGNFTGFYSGGEYPEPPNNPQYDMAPSGINMQSGHLMRATLTYNGTVLSETVADTVTGATYTNSYTANIPSLVAGNTAYVGFGGGTGAGTVTQNVQSWTYSVASSSTPQAAPPTFSPSGGTYSSPQSVKLSSASSGTVICYNTTGNPKTNGSSGCASGSSYTGPITVSSSETLYAVAGGSGYADSSVTTANYVIQTATAAATTSLINYPNGFNSAAVSTAYGASGTIWLSGATQSGSQIQLSAVGTDHGATNAWFRTPVNIQAFTTTFTFQIECSGSSANCSSGLGFMIICACTGGNPVYSPPAHPGFTYSGFSGNQFSWSQCSGVYSSQTGFPNSCVSIDSILVKFDTFNIVTGKFGASLTGFCSGGIYCEPPQNVSYDMAPSGINLTSGDVFRSTITYDGSTLSETLTDTATGATYSKSYSGVNLPSLVAGTTAFVGFGAGTGDTATQYAYLNSWTYNPQ